MPAGRILSGAGLFMTNRRNVSLILLLLTLVLPACQREQQSRKTGDKIHVGLVFDIGGKDDRSFNAAAWEGAKRAKAELPIVLRDVEPGDPSSIEPAMRAFAERATT